MKKIAALFTVFIIIITATACSTYEEKHLELPFPADDVENVEMFYYVNPFSAEKKTVTKAEDINALYNMFTDAVCTDQKSNESKDAEVYSFRFNLADGTDYELIYAFNGIKKGVLKSSTGGFEYFTSANIGWCWSQLNPQYVAEQADESELPH